MKGFRSLLWLLMKAEIASFSSLVERCTPRRSCFSVSTANHRSTRLSQLAEVGVKCRWYRGLFASERWTSVWRQSAWIPASGPARARHPCRPVCTKCQGEVHPAGHPRRRYSAPPTDHFINPLVFISYIAGENWLMMRDPVPQKANRSQVVMGDSPRLRDSHSGRSTWKEGSEMSIPYPAVLPNRK